MELMSLYITLQPEPTQNHVLQITACPAASFHVCLVSQIGGSIRPKTKQPQPDYCRNDSAAGATLTFRFGGLR
jgi:hypothetical protein